MIGKLKDEQIEELLSSFSFGRIGCNDGYNTYIYPLNFVYNGKYLLCHSQIGSKIRVMRENKRVCLQVDQITNETNWKSVMVLGDYQEIENERERYLAMKVLLERKLHTKISEEYFLKGTKQLHDSLQQSLNSRPVIFRIVIEEKTGRYENES
jgi:nitroimidazol reductase NimA-like FMN-containing flavoprotein (pyridoxamine 5'-phosphate oxidase superfamily)